MVVTMVEVVVTPTPTPGVVVEVIVVWWERIRRSSPAPIVVEVTTTLPAEASTPIAVVEVWGESHGARRTERVRNGRSATTVASSSSTT